jgi:hypothetical protein
VQNPGNRHTAACVAQRQKKNPRASEYDVHARWACNYRAVGVLGGHFVRKALKTANYETALEAIRQWEGKAPLEPNSGSITTADAVKIYPEDAKARNLGEATLTKLKTIFEDPVPHILQGQRLYVPERCAALSQ